MSVSARGFGTGGITPRQRRSTVAAVSSGASPAVPVNGRARAGTVTSSGNGSFAGSAEANRSPSDVSDVTGSPALSGRRFGREGSLTNSFVSTPRDEQASKLAADNNALHQDLQATKEVLSIKMTQVANLKKEVAAANDAADIARGEYRAVCEELEAKNQECSTLTHKMADYEEQLHDASKHHDERVSELKGQLALNERLAQQISSLQGDLDRAASERDDAVRLAAESVEAAAKLPPPADTRTAATQCAITLCDAAATQVETISPTTLDVMQANLTTAQRRLADLERSFVRSESEKATLLAQNEELAKRCDALTQQLADMESEVLMNDADTKHLAYDLERIFREVKHAARQNSSNFDYNSDPRNCFDTTNATNQLLSSLAVQLEVLEKRGDGFQARPMQRYLFHALQDLIALHVTVNGYLLASLAAESDMPDADIRNAEDSMLWALRKVVADEMPAMSPGRAQSEARVASV